MNVASPMIGCKYFVVNAFIVLNDEIGGETNPDPIAMGYSVLSLVMLFVFRCGKVRQPLLQSFGHNLFCALAKRADLVSRRRRRFARRPRSRTCSPPTRPPGAGQCPP